MDLAYATSIDASTQSGIAFAPNVTPGTFNDPPSPVDPLESTLFPPNDATRKGHAKKRDGNHIPRPPNAFILFRSSFIKNQHVSSEVETNHSTLSKIIGMTWQSLPNDERQIWHAKAKLALDEHKKKYPGYTFQPLHAKSKGTGEKRKVREVGPKDIKRCARIAELLVEGLKGDDLNYAIAEFDKTHVPEIITRFEAPITARSFRRSSSVPPPEPESKPSKKFLRASPAPALKKRSVSTEPIMSFTDMYSDCQSPSSSQSDFDAASEYYYDLPSSPIASTSSQMPPTTPSFDFSTFSFDSSSQAAPLDSYDPLMSGSQESVYDHYPQQHSQCMSQNTNTIPSPSHLTVNTSFYSGYPSNDYEYSPMSSVPGTPHDFSAQQSCASFAGVDFSDLPPLVDPSLIADPSMDFFADMPVSATYSTGVSPMYSSPACHYPTGVEYTPVTKPGFSHYEKPGYAQVHYGGIPSSYLAAHHQIPAYGL